MRNSRFPSWMQANVIDVQRYDAAYRQFETAVKEITEAVVQPKPMGQ